MQLKNIWSSKVLSLHTKIRLFNFNVKSVLLYGAETTTKKLQTFINNCHEKNPPNSLAKHHQ